MIRSPGQSDFVFEHDESPPVVANEASAGATRWVMRVTFFVLFVLTVLCLVGPHIPSGE